MWLPCTPCEKSVSLLAGVAGLACFVLLKAGPALTHRSADGYFAKFGAGLCPS